MGHACCTTQRPPVALYAIGGRNGLEMPMNSVERLDLLTGSWSVNQPMGDPRYGCTAVTLEGQIYVVGGLNAERHPLATVERFDVVMVSWESIADLNIARYHHAASVLRGSIFVMGGVGKGSNGRPTVLDKVERFDTGLQAWELMPNMNVARSGCGAAVVNGPMPFSSLGSQEFEEGDSACSTDRPPQQHPVRQISRAISVSGGGILYVAGGRDLEGARLASAECFDPDARTWERLAGMNISRSGLAAVSLGGALYVIGGADNQAKPLASVERFDPAIGFWGQLAPMVETRRECAAVVYSGSIYVVGGEGHSGWSGLSSGECFDPEKGTWVALETGMVSAKSGCAFAAC